MTVVLIIGLLMTAVALPIAGRRVSVLFRLMRAGQPAPDRVQNVTQRVGQAVKTQLIEVFGQKKLLKWSVPGTAHAFVMYAFIILASVYLEAYAVLFSRDPGWDWFIFGNWSVLGFAQDLISVLCLVGLAIFTVIRIQNAPERLGRRSRFSFSHLSGAWFTLFMIFNVIWTLFLFRGAVEARDMGTDHGYGKAAFVSYALGTVLPDSTALIGVGLLLHIGVMLVFLVFVLNSKHLHIFIAPLNVMFKRPDGPVALGAMKPMMSEGKPLDFENLDDFDEDTVMGVGKIEDFSWKGLLDFATCTECGRCQSQCPAWNTDKPLSPKLLVMGLRDHALAKAPYLLASSEEERENLPEAVRAEAERELVGATEGYAWEPEGGAVIDPDVLWSCTSCGACVQQCPVDIEHVDHIMDMRRYQVLVESNFPTELNQLFKGMENKGNPWNMSPNARMDWAKDLDFEVKQVGADLEDLSEVDWLFWVGCAGAYADRAKKTTRAVAELLNIAGVDFAVLGDGETCTGDPARRSGNEFVFQQLAMQNAEVFKETKARKVVSTCAHCFNTLKNEYSQFGVELEVVHHTQLLNRLVREGRLTPVGGDGASMNGGRSITYHDPCYLGRHNQVYSPPRELLNVLPNAEFKEMPRHGERSFCCGAGGARMWMEEKIGERINVNRTTEAVETGADQIATGCPFCRVMLSDGLTAKQADGSAREEVEVLDVAQLLLASVKRSEAMTESPAPVETKAEPEPGDVTRTEQTVTATEEVGADAAASVERDPEVESSKPDATDPDKHPSSADDELTEAESTAPDDDAAVRNARREAKERQDDTLF
jgi:Fe-S oxidoreductase